MVRVAEGHFINKKKNFKRWYTRLHSYLYFCTFILRCIHATEANAKLETAVIDRFARDFRFSNGGTRGDWDYHQEPRETLINFKGCQAVFVGGLFAATTATPTRHEHTCSHVCMCVVHNLSPVVTATARTWPDRYFSNKTKISERTNRKKKYFVWPDMGHVLSIPCLRTPVRAVRRCFCCFRSK